MRVWLCVVGWMWYQISVSQNLPFESQFWSIIRKPVFISEVLQARVHVQPQNVSRGSSIAVITYSQWGSMQELTASIGYQQQLHKEVRCGLVIGGSFLTESDIAAWRPKTEVLFQYARSDISLQSILSLTPDVSIQYWVQYAFPSFPIQAYANGQLVVGSHAINLGLDYQIQPKYHIGLGAGNIRLFELYVQGAYQKLMCLFRFSIQRFGIQYSELQLWR